MSVFICIHVSLLLRLSFSRVSLCVSALTPGAVYIYSSFCVCIYRCISVSVFFMPLCASAYLCVCVIMCSFVFLARLCVCADTPGSVYIYSSFCVSVFMVRLYGLCFSCLCVRLCTFICVLYLLCGPLSRASVCVCSYTPGSVYILFLFLCVRIYRCVSSVFFTPLCISV